MNAQVLLRVAVGIAPHRREQLAVRQRAPCMLEQRAQEIPFRASEVDRRTATDKTRLGEVDSDAVHLYRLVCARDRRLA